MSDASPGLATTRAIKLWYLKRFPLFHGFTPDELDDVLRSTQMREVEPGQPLYLPGEAGTQLYLLKRGVVKVSRLMANGRELTLALLKPGDVFGELEVVGDQPYETQAITHTDVLLCVMRKTDVLRWMARKPDLTLRLTKLIGLRRRVIENRLERLLFRSAPAKVAALLLELSEQFGRQDGAGAVIDLPLTHQDLASLTGSVRETVSDVLGEFRNRGWVALERKRVALLDRAALKRVTEAV